MSCMKTILEALVDDVNYPLPEGKIENKLIARGLSGDDEITQEVLTSNEYKGALADCLQDVLIQGISFSEADKSITLLSDKDKRLLAYINSLYNSIGESEIDLGEPIVYIGR